MWLTESYTRASGNGQENFRRNCATLVVAAACRVIALFSASRSGKFDTKAIIGVLDNTSLRCFDLLQVPDLGPHVHSSTSVSKRVKNGRDQSPWLSRHHGTLNASAARDESM